MDPFRITKYQGITEGRNAEDKLKRLGVSAVLSDANELYVSAEQVDKAIEVLGLPYEGRDAKQPGPWCPQCGRQLVSKKGSFSAILGLFASPRSWHCHECDEERRDKKSTINRLRKPIKRALVKMGYHSKPSFLIIGAQKAGTSALFQILQQHPQIVAPREKELRFFDDHWRIKYGDFVSYHEMFPLPYRLKPDRLTFEASPSYLFNPACAQRIYKYSPGIRLIIILREPVSRAFSAWKMNRKFSLSTNPYLQSLGDRRSFVEAVKEEAGVLEKTVWEKERIGYIKRGVYIEQLEKYLQHFSMDSLLILEHSHLLRDPQAVFAGVFHFLHIDDKFVIRNLRVNVAENNDEIPNEARDILRSIYKPYNERLFKLLGREYDW